LEREKYQAKTCEAEDKSASAHQTFLQRKTVFGFLSGKERESSQNVRGISHFVTSRKFPPISLHEV
jgi:hypothetical protein